MFSKKLFAGIAVTIMTLSLSGCGLFSSSTGHEPAELQQFKPLVRVNTVWRTNVGEGATPDLVPAVTDNAVYAAGGSELVRLDPTTGQVVWRAKTRAPITAGVGTDGVHIAVGTELGEVEVFDAEGQAVWHAQLSAEIYVPPLVGQGRVVVKTSDTRVSGFDLITGERLWHYQGQVPSLTVRTFNQMTWAPAGILVGQANGRMLALTPDGKTVFDAVISQASGITEVERLVDVVGRPWVDNELMCAAAFQGNVVCMNVSNGRLLWNAKFDAVTGPVADARFIYVVDAAGRIEALTREAGRVAWTNDALLYREPSAPVRVGATLAVGDYDGVISFLNPANGQFVARTKLSGAVAVPPQPLNYGAVFQTVKGEVALLTQEPLERSE